jgi:FKBP-type peptidyl-prolyl cis-trans isomerase (trigger factor)
MASELKRLENGTIELTLTVPWANVQKAYEESIEEAVAQAEIKGFRKGKAPRNLVEPNLDKNQIYSHAIQHVLPDVYAEAVKEHNLKPILYPQIRIQTGQENQDWVFVATTCEVPKVILPEYKSEIKELKIKNPDQKLTEILEMLVQKSQIVIPDLLVEEEANHRMGSLAENLTQLGMTTDQYLASKKITLDALKAQSAQEAKSALQLEFVLMEIQKLEKLENRQKTLEMLSSLV